MSYAQQLLIICPLIFFSAFVDSVAGGGGLISLPAYMLAGVPMHSVYACNKFSASWGAIFASAEYIRKGKVSLKPAIVSAVFALAGSTLGSKLNLMLDAGVLKTAMIFILPVAGVLVLISGTRKTEREPMTGAGLYVCCCLIGLVIGLYDGFAGPGTGSFMILCFTSIAGFDFITASGNAKIANLASNLAATAVFLAAGKVDFKLAIPASVAAIVGGIVGSKLAILKGNKFIKYTLLVVFAGIMVKLVIDVLG